MPDRPPAQPSQAVAHVTPRAHAAALIALAFGVYASGLAAPFVLDDKVMIVTDPAIRDLWSFGSYPNRPVLMFTLSLNYALSGPDPVAFRITNIAIHAIAALLLYGVVRRTLGLPRLGSMAPDAVNGVAFAVAALWVVHPLNTQAVTYVWQRSESMMGMFFLGAIYATVRSADGGSRGRWTALAVASCLLGFGTKEVMVAVIPVLLIYDWVLLSGSLGAALRARWPLYATLAAVAAIGVAVVLPNTSTSYGRVSASQYAASQPGIVLDYLRLALAPYPLCFDWGVKPTSRLLVIVPSLLAIIGMLAWTARELWRRSWRGVAGAWFFLVLAPTSTLVPVNDLKCEYRMYVPLAALTALGVAAGRTLCARWRVSPKLAMALALLLYGGLAVLRNRDYRSEIALWESSVAVQPKNTRAHVSLVTPYIAAGEPEQALRHARQAFGIKKTFATRWALAEALDAAGKPKAALKHCKVCADLRKRDAKVQQQMGRIYLKLNQSGFAADAYRRSIELAPEDASFHEEFARVCVGVGWLKEAEKHLREALRIEPARAVMLGFRALQSAAKPRSVKEAEIALRTALLIVKATDRREPDPLVALARVHAALGKPDLARRVFTEALNLPTVQQDAARRLQIERLLAALPRR